MAKNVSYRGKKEIIPVEGKIPYDAAVWQVSDSGDYINTVTGETRTEDQFDFNVNAAPTAPKASEEDDGETETSPGKSSSDWDEYSQDTGADFGGAQFKTGGGKRKK